jgi:hypothetical protein
MPRFLAQRLKTRLDVDDALRTRVSMMHAYLCEKLSFTKAQDQERCLQDSCTGLVTICKASFLSVLLWGHESASTSFYHSIFSDRLIFGPWHKAHALLGI